MQKKSIILTLILLLLLFNCAHQGFSQQIQTVIQEGTLSASELKELIDSKNEEYVLIDVRSPSEYNSGYIPTAINIPYTEIQENVSKIPKDKLIIVYCKVGGRAGTARKKLMELGYENIINFGGTYSWPYDLVK
jgi:rhodanese-related sulfurtransferase